MQNPFFSVVIPVYNRSERIMPARRRCPFERMHWSELRVL